MAFVRKQGKTKLMWLPWTTSHTASAGALVVWSSGYLVAASSTSAAHSIAGVIRHAIAATSTEYTTQSDVEVEVDVEKRVVWEGAVTSGLVVADRGLYCDLTDSVTVNRGGSTYDVVQVVKVISTTKGYFHLNIGPDGGVTS